MNKGSAFSPEYEISDTTESKSSLQEKSSTPQDNVPNDFITRIESDYKLSKPRRKLIQARIITK